MTWLTFVPGAVVKAACLESRRSRVRTTLWHPSLKKNEMFLPHSLLKIKYCGELPCPKGSVLGLRPSDLDFESCVSHYPQEVLLVQFSLYVHKSGLKPHFFSFRLLLCLLCLLCYWTFLPGGLTLNFLPAQLWKVSSIFSSCYN